MLLEYDLSVGVASIRWVWLYAHMTFFMDEPEDNDDESHPDFDELRKLEDLVAPLVEKASKIGLHAHGYMMGSLPSEGPDGEMMHKPVAIINFMPGELAWSERVQNPEKFSVDEEFKTITASTTEDEFEKYRRQFLDGESG